MTWTGGWADLAEAVQQRRARLGLTQEDVAAKGGPSTVTVRNIEAGKGGSSRSKTLFALDEALGWFQGTAQAIVEGESDWFLGSFDDFVQHVIRDTRRERENNEDYPVLAPTPTKGFVLGVRPSGPSDPALSAATDAQLITELANRLARAGTTEEEQDAKEEPQSEQDAGSTPSGGAWRGAPITAQRDQKEDPLAPSAPAPVPRDLRQTLRAQAVIDQLSERVTNTTPDGSE